MRWERDALQSLWARMAHYRSSFGCPERPFTSTPIFPSQGIRGVSLVLAPLATDAVMKTLGDWRRKQENEGTMLATFWGGGAFAFAFSLARILWLRSK
jgi:hypothetical protein